MRFLLAVLGAAAALQGPAATVPRGGGGLKATKPKPLLREAAIDLSIAGAAHLFFRRTHCTDAGTCELARAVVACRAFFVTVQSYLLAVYVRQLKVAKGMPRSRVVQDDLDAMGARLVRAVAKAAFFITVHLQYGHMAPLVNSCLTAVVALPYWWDRESSYVKKYGQPSRVWAAFAVSLGAGVAHALSHPQVDLTLVWAITHATVLVLAFGITFYGFADILISLLKGTLSN